MPTPLNRIQVHSPDNRFSLSVDRGKGIIKRLDDSVKPFPFTPTVTDIRNRIVCSSNSKFAIVGERGKFHRFALNGAITLIDTVNIPINGRLMRIGLSPDGNVMPVETNMGRLEILDLTNSRPILSKDVGSLGVIKGFFFEDNRLIVEFDTEFQKSYFLDRQAAAC